MKKRVLIMVITFLMLAVLFSVTASASPPPFDDDFDTTKQYKVTTNTSWLEIIAKLLDAIVNFMMSVTVMLGWVVVYLFKLAMGADLANIFGSGITDVLNALNMSIFAPLLILGYAMAFFLMAKQFLKRNTQGMVIEFCKILAVVILSVFITTYAAETLEKATETSKNIGTAALLDVANSGSSSPTPTTSGNYADNTANLLWNDLVYKPWKTVQFWGVEPPPGHNVAMRFLEFNYVPERILEKPDNVEQEEWDNASRFEKLIMMLNDPVTFAIIELEWGGTIRAVDDFVAANPGAFDKEYSAGRIGYMLAYAIPFTIKCLLYLLVAVILLFYQFMAILYVLLAPIVLLLSLFPMFGGFELLNKWFRKLLETQIMIIVVTFMLGLIIRSNEFFQGLGVGVGGEIAAMFLQAAVTIALVWKHNAILAFLGVGGAAMVAGAGAAVSRSARAVRSTVHHRRIERSIKSSSKAWRGTPEASTGATATHTDRVYTQGGTYAVSSTAPPTSPAYNRPAEQTPGSPPPVPPPSVRRANNRSHTGEVAPVQETPSNIPARSVSVAADVPPPPPFRASNRPPSESAHITGQGRERGRIIATEVPPISKGSTLSHSVYRSANVPRSTEPQDIPPPEAPPVRADKRPVSTSRWTPPPPKEKPVYRSRPKPQATAVVMTPRSYSTVRPLSHA